MRVFYWHDLRYAARQLRRHLGFTFTCVLVLGLGIGVGTAMFSVLAAVLLRPLPYAHAGELVAIALPNSPGDIGGEVSILNARAWRERSHAFAAIAYSSAMMATLERPGRTDQIEDMGASGNLFATLGVTARLGRGLIPSDESQRARVAVLSDAVWREEFQSEADIVGRAIELNDNAYTVVGVMPAGFSYPFGEMAGVWTPYVPGIGEESWESPAFWLQVIGRPRPGVGLAQARAEIGGIQAELARAHHEMPAQVEVLGYHDELVAGARPALGALAGAVGLVWLIACCSVAGLLLTRWAGRRRELAVRAALGARPARLAAQLLNECALLAAMAAVAGWGLAYGCVAGLRHWLVARLPPGIEVHLDARVLAGLLGLTAASVMAIGIAPALLAARASGQEGLRGGSAIGARGQSRLRDGLVVGEIALALVLLAGAGLLLRTIEALRRAPLGFSTANIVSTELMIPMGRFEHRNMIQTFDQPLLARLQALPGVEAAAFSSVIPLEGGFRMSGSFKYVGRPGVAPDRQPQGDLRFSSPGYAAVFGIPIERGRFFDAGLDTPHSGTVIVVNHTFAAKYFAGENPLGQQISMGSHQVATIIGVLADVHGTAIAAPPNPEMQFSTTQLAPGQDLYAMSTVFTALAVRTRLPVGSAVPAIRGALHTVAPDLAPEKFRTMEQIVSDSIGGQILAERLLSLFAVVALAIALAGLYGLLAYSVAQRTREMGIRMALGAERRQIIALVLGRAGWLLGVGIVVGMGVALASSRVLAAYLYGVPARDPLVLAGVAVLLAAAGLAAAYGPARRAAGASPTDALRSE